MALHALYHMCQRYSVHLVPQLNISLLDTYLKDSFCTIPRQHPALRTVSTFQSEFRVLANQMPWTSPKRQHMYIHYFQSP